MKLKNKFKRESLKNYAEYHTDRQENEQQVGKMERQGLQNPTSSRKLREKENAGHAIIERNRQDCFLEPTTEKSPLTKIKCNPNKRNKKKPHLDTEQYISNISKKKRKSEKQAEIRHITPQQGN